MKRVLLTGATGYLGRHLLRDLLRDGHDVTAIVRRRDGRLAERLAEFDGFGRGTLTVLEGDVRRYRCGLHAEAVAALTGRIDAFVHCAGMTEFDPALAQALAEHNTHGTRNAFELCRDLIIPHFHHVSTAFAATGTFRNPYERSKYDAERFLDERREDPVIVSIYRPTIVVGGRVLGEDGSAGTLYAYLKSLRFIRECFRSDAGRSGKLARKYGASLNGGVWHIPLRVEADARVRLNLVHVDDVAERIVRQVRRPPGARQIQLLASAKPSTVAEVKNAFCRVLGIDGIALTDKAAFAALPRNSLEDKFRRMTATFQPYLQNMPEFAGTDGLRDVPLERIAGDFLEELEKRMTVGDRLPLGSMAIECLDAARAGKYLDKFSEGQFGESLLKRIPFAEAKNPRPSRSRTRGTRLRRQSKSRGSTKSVRTACPRARRPRPAPRN